MGENPLGGRGIGDDSDQLHLRSAVGADQGQRLDSRASSIN
jgi:hypothetical protein